MDFHPDEDHRAYVSTLRRLLADAAPLKAARAWAAGDPEPGRRLWRSLADTGLVALAVPAAREGLGHRPPELASAFFELGRAGVPGPVVETVAVAAALGAAGDAGDGAVAAAPWLGPAMAGDALLTVADPAGPYALDAHLADAAFVLERAPGDDDGDPGPVFAGAPHVLRLAAPEGAPRDSIDPVRRLTRCAPAPGGTVAADTVRLRSLATLLTAAQTLGAGRALLDGSVEHAAHRTQFGRPIGSFQAVKHMLATVAVELEFAGPLLYGAAVALARGDTGSPDLPAAKAACSDAAYGAARTALQVHGALGYTDEYDLTLHLRKARALRGAWGTPAACRAGRGP
ncbi:acyl-CoA/acyl-ACP dehydrogenase, partial [Streptomyces daliensis]|nr:acyl-CoA/acyl-ACP dehydrogenase [Streptomyces daliensis]